MRTSFDERLTALVGPGEVVTIPDIIGRALDNGVKDIPTSGSIARALRQHPQFDQDNDTHRRHYRRVEE